MRLRAARLLLAFVALTGCAASPCETRPPARIQLLLVNDVYQLQPVNGRGGLARVATLKRQLATGGHTPVLVLAGDFLSPSVASTVFQGQQFVLAGDTLSPSLLSTLFQGRQMIEVWNALGLDAAVFGNHEFDFGPAVLRERMQESRFPWLGANVLDAATQRPWGGAEAALVREWSGARVGVVGVTLLRFPSTSSWAATITRPWSRRKAARSSSRRDPTR